MDEKRSRKEGIGGIYSKKIDKNGKEIKMVLKKIQNMWYDIWQ